MNPVPQTGKTGKVQDTGNFDMYGGSKDIQAPRQLCWMK